MNNNQPDPHTSSASESADHSAEELKQSEQIVDEGDAKRAADEKETKDNS
jgi:hypothetical protein